MGIVVECVRAGGGNSGAVTGGVKAGDINCWNLFVVNLLVYVIDCIVDVWIGGTELVCVPLDGL